MYNHGSFNHVQLNKVVCKFLQDVISEVFGICSEPAGRWVPLDSIGMSEEQLQGQLERAEDAPFDGDADFG